MQKSRKLCFVIMGFGTKTDFESGKKYNLDKTYKHIIKPAAEAAGYKCIRADEISESGLIDKSMYALLLKADLVIADITTFNPNAIYELGIRHAVRPFSTIILKEKEGKIPFDLDHTRTIHYHHLGDDIGVDEAEAQKNKIQSIIESITEHPQIDSPLYEFISDIQHPELSNEQYKTILGEIAELEKREGHIFAVVEEAILCMENSEFEKAKKNWEKASNAAPNEVFYIQQNALATYKSETPSIISSLTDALSIISTATENGNTNDPETLGILGAIHKRLWHESNDREYLNRARDYYEKGFQIRDDFYNGENFANCDNLLAGIEEDKNLKIYFDISAKKTRKKILGNFKELIINLDTEETSADNKWQYATIANCYFGLGDIENGEVFEEYFFRYSVEWEKKSYLDSKRIPN